MPEREIRIVGSGSYLPEAELPSSELEARLGLREGWIERRTGVRSRRIAAEDEGCVDLATRAAERALASAGVPAEELTQIILATSTPDHLLPPTSYELAYRLGSDAQAFDLAGACCGFLLALEQARARCFATEGPVLVVAANLLSRRVDWKDAATASLFGDGAGAVVVQSGNRGRFVIGTHCGRSDGSYKDAIWIAAGGARQPLTHELLESGAHLMRFGKGAAPFRRAVDLFCEVAAEALTDTVEIDHFLPHQANTRLLDMVAQRLSIPTQRVHSHLARYGNTSAASIPILLDEARDDFRPGESLLLASVGSGLTASATLLVVAE